MSAFYKFVWVLLSFLSFPAFASGCNWHPYVGADFQLRHMDFEYGFGENTLKHGSKSLNGYVGIRIHEHMALEGGFDSTGTLTRVSTICAGEMAAGAIMPNGLSPAVFKSKIKLQGPHLNILGLCPLYHCLGRNIELFGSIGAAFLKATSERQTVSIAGIPASRVRTLADKKTVLRLTIGLQYQLSNHLGIRGTVGWLNTARLIIYKTNGIPGLYIPQIKPKNTVFAGLGLFLAF